MSAIELLDFYAEWCGPCHHMEPIIQEIEKELGDSVKINKINVDTDQDTAGEYNVMSMPTYIIKKDGKVVDQLVGVQSKDTLLAKLKYFSAS
ncbi:thioredoxin [Candidatus Berkelbacteria bacterium CG10_big_fil_rev_8_21_14_0_10_43_14]|uniref:Thioredoxin n=1 Tax=Candidatus Berkelbacteria bacterium CG10_big_fil_rev_8_21_14_0_10_43_14 TaxID=1974515 RepID=A0A2M6R842_9BACT|nr:MAG: thioredoxin [Candidatus Berkelbacteria bacterium CG10_big_fil_rev_8_21_14_0_10_43_14]